MSNEQMNRKASSQEHERGPEHMSNEQMKWRAKVAAWLHDPPEKALVLLRGKGHEAGTTRSMLSLVFDSDDLPADVADAVRDADRWAAAADRPERPQADREGHRYPVWDRVTFSKAPVLVHPLSGDQYELNSLEEIVPDHAEQLATQHYRDILGEHPGEDLKRSFLRLWRFGPEAPAPQLDKLWQLLPADSRTPDHSIWEHLGLVSAFAGAFATGDVPALLNVTLGPVQSFIEQARSSSDLWAGSHLLSTLSWQAMKVVCEACGPDSIVMPALRGVPCVDLWLRSKDEDFDNVADKICAPREWKGPRSDANPLFSATLPNRFLAIVPARRAESLAREIRDGVRRWAEERAQRAWSKVYAKAGLPDGGHAAKVQIPAQLAEFPEVHWVAIPWSLACNDGNVDTARLRGALAAFYPEGAGQAPGFLGRETWKQVTATEATAKFWKPNPGMLYPALYELGERAAAVAKATRCFQQLRQQGYRCSLCGERERLVYDDGELQHRPGKDFWKKVGEAQPSWTKKGEERMCAVCTLKRLWPTLFVEELKDLNLEGIQRFVVSTQSMALVSTMNDIRRTPEYAAKLERILGAPRFENLDRIALPPKMAQLDNENATLRKLPAAVSLLADLGDETGRRALEKELGLSFEKYYALVQMDGDRLGAWLSSSGDDVGRPCTKQLWHPEVANSVAQEFPDLAPYLEAKAAPTPAYHSALSGILNDLSLHLIPAVVEGAFNGKVLYAGGDDLLAMVPVSELLPMMMMLRHVFSGQALAHDGPERLANLEISRGHALHGKRLRRTMGPRATCSMGAVVAHYSAPLGGVLRDLRAAERRAKERGRDAFSITLAKRAGGTTALTCRWRSKNHSPMDLLQRLSAVLRNDVSRRAAYHLVEWLKGIPEPPDQHLLESMLAHQFRQQAIDCENKAVRERLEELARHLAAVAREEASENSVAQWLDGFIQHAEFLARAQRGGRTKHEQRREGATV